jgi:hypothetical protein
MYMDYALCEAETEILCNLDEHQPSKGQQHSMQ